MEYNKLAIKTVPQAEELISSILMDFGAKGVEIQGGEIPDVSGFDYICEDEFKTDDFSVAAYFLNDEGFADVYAGIRSAVLQAQTDNPEMEFGALSFSVDTLCEEDWANAWKKYFKPQKVSDFVVIKPTWEAYTPAQDETVIEIDPGMAFGTGTHETTKMCIRMLEEFQEPGSSVLDVGCGSGILSIASGKLGAGSILGLDLDPVAVEVARENVARNGLADKTQIIASDITQGVPKNRKFDIVLANIIADVIIRLSENIREYMKMPGVMICSGIIQERLDDVLTALEAAGLKTIKIEHLGEWCAVAVKNKR